MTILTKQISGVKLNPKGANSLESGTVIEQVHFFFVNFHNRHDVVLWNWAF